MSMVDKIAPYLMSMGALVVALAIIFSEDVWNLVDKLSKKRLSRRLLIQVGLCAVLAVPTFFYFNHMVIEQAQKLADTAIYYGRITVGDEPIPISNIPENSTTIMLGDKVAVFMRKDQNYVFANQDVPLISLGYDSDGGILINIDLFDSKNRKILDIENNVFYSDKRLGYYPFQPNYHTLLVDDSGGNQVLKIDYMNTNIIRISGKFYVPDYRNPFIITPDSSVHFDGLYVSDTNPFRFDITTNPIHGFLNITAKGGLSVAGNIIGEGTAK